MSKVIIPEETERLAKKAVHAAFLVHRTLGPGLLESAYHQCLVIELEEAGLRVEREKLLPLNYRGRAIEHAYRLDLVVNDSLLIEVKAVEAVQPIHRVQVATCLRLLTLPLGLLINFNVPLIKDGITRVLDLDLREPVPVTFAQSLAP